jgi:hypothetical protein
MTTSYSVRARLSVRARALCALGVSAAALSLGVACGGATTDHYSPLSRPSDTPGVHLEETDPGWDCHTMGNHLCGTDYATWDEPNVAMPSGYEHMYGQLSQMPAGSVHVHVVRH